IASASSIAVTISGDRALPTSGRFSISVRTPPSCSRVIIDSTLPIVRRRGQHALGHVELEPEEPLPQRLALVVDPQGQRTAATERVAQEEVERAQPRQLEARDLAADEIGEARADGLGAERLPEERVGGRRTRDDADVRMIALVAGARIG